MTASRTRPDPEIAPRQESAVAAPATIGAARVSAAAVLGLVLLALLVAASLVVGAKTLSPAAVGEALREGPRVAVATETHSIVWSYRVPRTLLGLLVGGALGVAGALIQGYTRNPLADPGILGVNAGAALAVVLAIALLGATATSSLIGAAILGAGLASVAAVLIGSLGRGPATPVRMTLAGVALGAFLGGLGAAIRLSDVQTFDRYRVWAAGSLLGRDPADAARVAPILAVGLLLALACARGLNALALGEDMANALGARVRLTRWTAIAGLTLLAGGATAVAGPIGFVGLMVPHAVRWTLGPDYRVIVPLGVLGGAILLLAADVLARVLIADVEVPVGVVTAFLGAPLLMALARRRAVNAL